MPYHHTISGLAEVQSIRQYEYNDHVEAWLRSRIRVVGPKLFKDEYYYEACIGSYMFGDKLGFGISPDEARSELMAQLGF